MNEKIGPEKETTVISWGVDTSAHIDPAEEVWLVWWSLEEGVDQEDAGHGIYLLKTAKPGTHVKDYLMGVYADWGEAREALQREHKAKRQHWIERRKLNHFGVGNY